MTTIDPQASAACQQDTSSLLRLFPCRDESTSFDIRPEWIPIDEIAKTWADFSLKATNALALQATGTAFLALAFETSAYKHYNQAYHGLWRQVSSAVAQDIGHAIADLSEACQQWASVALWLERFANEERHDEEMLDTIRTLFERIQEQQRRLWPLLLRVREEQRIGHGGPLTVHLGHLSSTLATVQEKEG